MERKFIIYKITNLINGKIYIGQTIRTLKQRFAEHKSSKTTLIGQAIQKYGRENFKIETVEKCKTLDKLNEREKFWIAQFNSKSPHGYNLTDGGDGAPGFIPSEETKAKRSAKMKGRKLSPEHYARLVEANRHHSPESYKKAAEKNRGRHLSPETRAKLSEAAKKRANTPEGKAHLKAARQKQIAMGGFSADTLAKMAAASREHHHSPESRAKIGAAHRGKKLSEETKLKISEAKRGKKIKGHKHSEETKRKLSLSRKDKKRVRCIETNEVFESIRAAAKKYKADNSDIGRVCKGLKKTVAGMHWEFVDDDSTNNPNEEENT